MVNALHRKLLRDLWHLRAQVAAIGVVAAFGIATVLVTYSSYRSLVLARAAYYADYRFADVFARLTRAPESLARRLAAIGGVAAVETRVVTDVTLDVPGLAEPATGRLVSVPAGRRPILNDVHLRRGRYLEPGDRHAVLASEAFAGANHLDVGDRLGAVINGRWQTLEIVGIAISPEYTYEIRGGADLLPDNRRFGVLWMERESLGPAFDMEGAFNDVTLALAPGADEAAVIERVDRLLARYGGVGAYGHDEQVSARFLRDEIAQNRVSGTIVPAIFLGVAAFLLNVVLARLVGTEREQIGVLKAFGYSNRTIGLHYLTLALVALGLGSAGGVALGIWWGKAINAVYQQYYRFPELPYRLDAAAVGLAVLVSVAAATVGALAAVRRAAALPPAEAMRPEPPPRFRAGPAERLGLHRLFAVPGRIVLRNLERRPVKAALSAAGIALSVTILLVGRYFYDAFDGLLDLQFREVQREDVTVAFTLPQPRGVGFELAHLPGVLRAEPYRAVPVRIRAAYRSRRTAILGLAPSGELRRLVDGRRRRVPLPSEGLLLTAKLGDVLDVRPGDTVTVEVMEGGRPVRPVAVAGLIDEPLGLSAYMAAAALDRLAGEGATRSGAFLATDPRAEERLFTRLKRLPAIQGMSSRQAAVTSFQETIGHSMGIATAVLILCASAIAVAVVYNSARIALSERARELASLRVLGFTRGEITRMLLGEQAALTVAAIPVGLLAGYGFCALLSRTYQWELFRLPLVVSGRTYVFAAGVVLLATIASGLLIRRRLNRLDLVSVLKTRE